MSEQVALLAAEHRIVTSEVCQSAELLEGGSRQCRICLSSEDTSNDMIAPCMCKGTAKWYQGMY